MFTEKNRGRRAAAEAKAIERKAQRHGGQISSKDAARLTKVRGRVVRYSYDEEPESDDQY
jgi:hypothetical protein